MDIGMMSIGMNQASLQNAASISVLKMAMSGRNETVAQMTDMMSNIAVDTSKGTNIDIKV